MSKECKLDCQNNCPNCTVKPLSSQRVKPDTIKEPKQVKANIDRKAVQCPHCNFTWIADASDLICFLILTCRKCQKIIE